MEREILWIDWVTLAICIFAIIVAVSGLRDNQRIRRERRSIQRDVREQRRRERQNGK